MNDVSGAKRHDPDLAPPRAATAWAVVGLAAVLAFGAYLRFVAQGPLGIDEWWHGIAGVTRGSVPFAVAAFLAEVGSGLGAAVCAAIAAALFFALRMPRAGATVMTAMLLGVAGSQLLKMLVARPRPWDQLYSSNGHSYPSGHTMGAAALVVSLALIVRYSGWVTRQQAVWVNLAAAGWIVLMAWSRTSLHVHWLSDTVAGAILGTVSAFVAFALWKPQRAVSQVDVGGSL